MTISEAVTALLYPYEVDINLVHLACIDNEMVPEELYDVDMKGSVAKATIAILRNLITLQSESNGGYSLSYNIDGVRERISQIARDNGLKDVAEEYSKSRIIDRTDSW